MMRVLCNKFFIVGALLGIIATGGLWLYSSSRDFTISNTTCDRPFWPNHSLMEPGHTDAQVIQYAKDAIQVAFNFNSRDVEIRLAEARPYFTCTGFSRLIKFFQKEGIVSKVIKFNGKLSVTFEQAAVVESIGYEDSRYSHKWIVRVPAMLKPWQPEGRIALEKIDFLVTVVRSDEPDVRTPIGINDLRIIRLHRSL